MARTKKFDARLSAVPVTDTMFDEMGTLIESLGLSQSEFIRNAVDYFIAKDEHDISEMGFTKTLGTTSCTQETKDGIESLAQEFGIKPVTVIRLAIEDVLETFVQDPNRDQPNVRAFLDIGKEDENDK